MHRTIARTAMTLVTTAALSACATTTTLPAPRGEPLGAGMFELSALTATSDRNSRAEPWTANYFQPSLQRDSRDRPGDEPSMTAVGPVTAAGYLFFHGYKATLSRVDGSTCRFSPSCSAFGLEATRRYGLSGMLMTFGRLQKNHSAESHYPMDNPPFLTDPPSAYGFTSQTPRLDEFDRYEDPAHAWYQHLRAVRTLHY